MYIKDTTTMFMFIIGYFCQPTVKEMEMKRSKDAFKRVATLGGQMSDIVFSREVLGDGVPDGIANVSKKKYHGTYLYNTCSWKTCPFIRCLKRKSDHFYQSNQLFQVF